jgi:hypothetical protein
MSVQCTPHIPCQYSVLHSTYPFPSIIYLLHCKLIPPFRSLMSHLLISTDFYWDLSLVYIILHSRSEVNIHSKIKRYTRSYRRVSNENFKKCGPHCLYRQVWETLNRFLLNFVVVSFTEICRHRPMSVLVKVWQH